MNSLFGIPMDTLTTIAAALFAALTALLAVLALRNRLLLALGLRNIPRRRAQTVLIVVGLMLSTVIITSAFGTGDTVGYTIRHLTVDGLGAVDETVQHGATADGTGPGYIPDSLVGRLRQAAGTSADGVTGAIVQSVALQDLTSRQTKSSAVLEALPRTYPAAFGPLTRADGTAVTLGQLGPNQVYFNQKAATALSAHPGDHVSVYLGGRAVDFTVRDTLQGRDLATGGLSPRSAGSGPAVLLPLDRLQQIAGLPGQVNVILVSNRGDAIQGATLTDSVLPALRAPLANSAQVATVQRLLLTPAGLKALHGLQADKSLSATTRSDLRTLEREIKRPVVSDRLKSLVTDPAVAGVLGKITAPSIARSLDTALVSASDYTVQGVKQDGLNAADQTGSEFTTIFLVFGLFSIAAGIMLIFLIFVMLAAERRPEMGMARAVGTRRSHLIQQFLFEGYAYDIGAALVGAGLGIVIGLSMVSVISALLGSFGISLQAQISPRSVVLSFCLGALVTFATVAFSAWRTSRLNIVAAIRDLPDGSRIDGSIAAAFARPWKDLALAGRRLRAGHPLRALAALLAAPWHLVSAFRVFISRGPLLLALGALMLQMGISSKQLFPFDLGISLLLVGAAMLLRWLLKVARTPERIANRIGFTLAGLALVVFWLLPFDAIRSDLNFDVEMFFLSGMMLVLGGVWTLMYNGDLLLGALLAVLGRARALAPVLRTAISYPMQYRFRTGLTLSMFSLVIFTLMVMSVLNSSFSGIALDLNRDNGGYDIHATASPLSPIADISAAIKGNPSLRNRISSAGSLGRVAAGLRQPGQKDQTWQPGLLNVADDAYLAGTRFTLHSRAVGYATDTQVWQTIRSHPGYAVVSSDFAANSGNGGRSFVVHGLNYKQSQFRPATIEMRDMRNGITARLTIIGVLDQQSYFGNGLYTGASTLAAAHDAPAAPAVYYMRVAPGQDVHAVAKALGSAFLANGLDVVETRVEYATDQSIGSGMNYLLEGFMALGLIVGIAALGVIATRSVVERRQQIGVLRAIGFRRRMVQASFMIESSFISLVGTALGVGLGVMLARQLVAYIGKSNPSLHVIVPWGQILGIVALAYLASLLTTYLPARQAARIYPAEALRYE